MLKDDKVLTDVLLVGGGHAHVQVIRAFAMRPVKGVRLTLVSPDPHTPYSGMLPGLIAGHYSFDETHIDLNALCRFAGARYIQSSITGLDPEMRQVQFDERAPLSFDYVSLDTGSTPRLDDVPGAAEFAIPVKPISKFLKHWEGICTRAANSPGACRIAVAGAGAGGVELLLAAQFALNRLRASAGLNTAAEFQIFTSGNRILPGSSPALQETFMQLLKDRNVTIRLNEGVVRLERGRLHTTSGAQFETDEILWVTAAGAPQWPKAAGLDVNALGFISVRSTLQSTSHEHVFAAGDIADMIVSPRPKAGVFAVRQGPVLAENLRRLIAGQPLKAYRPQKDYLKIIATGDKSAVASRNGLSLGGPWIWRWKDRIDRRFMEKFNSLPAMSSAPSLLSRLATALSVSRDPIPAMRCAGCGGKISNDTLQKSLAKLHPVRRDDVIAGLEASDDAAILLTPHGMVSVQTADFFRAMIDDPFVFGQIAATHALGDIYAMGAQPQSALTLVTLPESAVTIAERDLTQLLQGALSVLNKAGAALVGGHTGEGSEISLGFSITGLAARDAILTKRAFRSGDHLILTKSLGTGALLAADMRHLAKGRHVAAAIESMLHSQASAARIFSDHGAAACTDVTGFGLAGHLLEMLAKGDTGAELDMSALQILEGTIAAIAAGIYSSLHDENARALEKIETRETSEHDFQILFDPQTCGGLLAGIAPAQSAQCLADLHDAGYRDARVIGTVFEKKPGVRPIRLKGAH